MVEVKTIQDALKSGRVILGYKESIKNIKIGKVKFIVMANNIPEDMRKEIEHHAKIAKIKVDVFSGNSKELGTFCGKPFPVLVLTIRGEV